MRLNEKTGRWEKKNPTWGKRPNEGVKDLLKNIYNWTPRKKKEVGGKNLFPWPSGFRYTAKKNNCSPINHDGVRHKKKRGPVSRGENRKAMWGKKARFVGVNG